MKPEKFNSILKLLDDPDEIVYRALEHELISEGLPVIGKLEDAWSMSENPLVHERIENITHHIQLSDSIEEFKTWAESDKLELMDAAFLVSKYQYPLLDKQEFIERITQIGEDIAQTVAPSLSPLEKIRAVNHILYRVCRFERARYDSQSPQWFFVNNVLSQKKGNVYSLCLLYAAVAQYAGIRLRGLVLPDNLTLAFLDPKADDQHLTKESSLFYLNPNNRGAVFGKLEIEDFLRRSEFDVSKEQYYVPVPNYVLVSAVLGGIKDFYLGTNKMEKAEDLESLISTIRETGDAFHLH